MTQDLISTNKPLDRSSLIVMVGALLIALISLFASAYIFTGFLGGGRSPWGVLQAFFLCFGLGAIAYLPALTVFFMARYVRGFGPQISIGLAAIFISLPLLGYGGISLYARLIYWPYGLAAFIIGLGLFVWAVRVLLGARINHRA